MSDSLIALEVAEMDATADLYSAAGPDVISAAGLSVATTTVGVLVAASRVDVLALNRIIGLGLRAIPSDAALDDLLKAFERIGSPRFFLPIAPVPGHEELAARIRALGVPHYNNWMRLQHDLKDVPDAPSTPLEVRQVGSVDADQFGQIVAAAFHYPPAITRLAGQVIGRPRWRHYMAYSRGAPIATGALYISGEAAWFGFAATDAAYRRRGAQQALVIRRLRDAKDAGCRWVSVETAEDTVMRDAPSFRNLSRLGFEVAYRRPNYLWTRGSARP